MSGLGEIFKLKGSVYVDNEQANKSIQKTDEKAEGLGNKFLSGIGTAAKWGAGIAAAAGAGAVALAGMAVKTAGVTDNIDKMSQKIGISREAYQELDFICSQSGTSVDNLKNGLKTLTTQMQSAADGSKSAKGYFDELGLSWEDGNGKLKDQETMMWEAFSALQGMENQTEKSALATKLFGKAGLELLPMLNGADGSIESMKQQAHDLGLVLNDETIDAGVKFTDSMDQAKRALDSIVTKIGGNVMPIFQSALEWVLNNMPMIQQIMESVFKSIEVVVMSVGAIFQSIFVAINDYLSNTGITFNDVFSAIQEIFNSTIEVLQDIWNTIGVPIFTFMQQIIGTVAEYFSQKMPEIANFFQKMTTDIGQLWQNNLKPCFSAIGDFLNNVVAPAFDFVFNTIIVPILDSAFQTITDLWENTLKPVFTGITDFLTGVFTGNWEQAFKGLTSIVEGAFNGLEAGVKYPLNAVIGIINKFIKKINTLKIPDWVPEVGGKGINIREIPLLAKGGNIVQSGRVIVGDAGPEILDLPVGAKVTPLTGNINQQNDSNDLADILKKIYDILFKILDKDDKNVVLDTGELVGVLTPVIDKKLGKYGNKPKRGN